MDFGFYSGNVVVQYTYDTWGKVISTTGSMASTLGQYNPFRYRSYYYDTETGFYYLQSRYYDPTVGRFLNADHPELIGVNGGIEGYNMFAYCNNNPVSRIDNTGCSNETISPAPKCPEGVLSQIGEQEGVYSGCHVDGEYIVYVFSDLEVYERTIFFFFKTGELALRGTVTKYYFKKTDYRAEYEHYMWLYHTTLDAINLLDVSNGGGPFYDGPIVHNYPSITLSLVLTLAGVLQYAAVSQADYYYDMAQQYKNKPDTYKLYYIITETHLESEKFHERKEYV